MEVSERSNASSGCRTLLRDAAPPLPLRIGINASAGTHTSTNLQGRQAPGTLPTVEIRTGEWAKHVPLSMLPYVQVAP
jgi:hypothetical protein